MTFDWFPEIDCLFVACSFYCLCLFLFANFDQILSFIYFVFVIINSSFVIVCYYSLFISNIYCQNIFFVIYSSFFVSYIIIMIMNDRNEKKKYDEK